MPRPSPATPLHPLERRLLSHLRREGLVRPGEHGLLAVSGGSDSTALLLLLHRLAGRLGLALSVVHFDHGLRPEAGADAAWVRALAGRLGLPCVVRRHETLAARPSGRQAAARDWRRDECARLCGELGADWAATGHQHDDQQETLLLGLLRGQHLTHLRGIAARQPPYLRPLLPFSREALRDYLTAQGQDWREDASNASPAYLRNRVRHELLPLLTELTGGGIDARLSDLAEQSRALGEALRAFPAPPQNDPARPPHWLDAAALAALPHAAATTALHTFIQARLPGAVRYAQLARAADLAAGARHDWSLNLPGQRKLLQVGSRILLEQAASADGPDPCEPVLHHRGITLYAPPGTEVSLDGDAAAPMLCLHNLPLGSALTLRPCEAGDRFWPPGAAAPVRLGRFLAGRGMRAPARRHVPLVVREGQVIAVYPDMPAHGHERPRGSGTSLSFAIRHWPAAHGVRPA